MAAVTWSIIALGAVLPATYAVRDGLTERDGEVCVRPWSQLATRAFNAAAVGAMAAGFVLALVGLVLLAVGVIE